MNMKYQHAGIFRQAGVMLFLITLWHIPAAFAATDAECTDYAYNAVQQLQMARDLGMPDLDPPTWLDDYDAHYNWCLPLMSVIPIAENARRQVMIDQYRAGMEGAADSWGYQMPEESSTKKKVSCETYAIAAVQQYHEAETLGIPVLQLPLWTDDHQIHVDWCMQAENYQLVAESLRRQQKISNYISYQAQQQQASPPVVESSQPQYESGSYPQEAPYGQQEESYDYHGQASAQEPAGPASADYGGTPVYSSREEYMLSQCEIAEDYIAQLVKRNKAASTGADPGFRDYVVLRTGDRYRFAYEGTSKGRGYVCVEIVEKSSTPTTDTYQIHANIIGQKEIRLSLAVSHDSIAATDFISIRKNSQISRLPAEAILSFGADAIRLDTPISLKYSKAEGNYFSGQGRVLSTSSELSVSDVILSNVLKVVLEGTEPSYEAALYLANGVGPARMDLIVEDELLYFKLDIDGR